MNDEKKFKNEMLDAMQRGGHTRSRQEPTPWQPKRLEAVRTAPDLPMKLASRPEDERNTSDDWQPSSRPGAVDRQRKRRQQEISLAAEPITADDTIEQMAAKQPEELARAIQTVRLSADKDGMIDALEKVAILVIALGSDLSAPVLNHCDWDEVQDITQAVIEVRTVLPEKRKAVVEEFRQLLLSGDYILRGGPEYAQRMLQRAFPREWVGRLHNLMRSAQNPYSLFSEIDPRYLVPFIAKEHPQTIALILSQLDSAQSAAILTRLDPELQQDVAYRVATLDHVPLQTLRRLEDVLASDLRAILSDQAAEFGGPGVVARILNQTSRDTENNVMSGLEDRNTELADAVRDRSFVFNDIVNLQTREVRTVVAAIEPDDLLLALKASGDEIKAVLMEGLDEEDQKRIRKKIEKSDRTRLADAEAAQERIAQVVRRLNDEGKVRIVHGDAAGQFV